MKTGGLQYAMELIDKNFGVGIGKAKKIQKISIKQLTKLILQ